MARDKSEKRESILQAAQLAFSAEGFDGTSMDRIADTAGASKRTVYNHFQTKEELFYAVVERFVEGMLELKDIHFDPARSVADQLGDFAEAELASVRNPEWFAFMKVLLSVLLRNPEAARRSAARYEGRRDSLELWLEQAASAGALDVDNPALAARVFWSMLGGAFTWPALYGGGVDLGGVDALKEELIATFLARFGAEGH